MNSDPFRLVPYGVRDKKRRIRFVWTCSDYVSHEHRWYWSARVCGQWQRFKRWLTGDSDANV